MDFEFTVPIGDQMKTCRIMKPAGGSEMWNVFVDRYLVAQFVPRSDGLEAHVPPASWVQADDLQLLYEILADLETL